MLSVQQSTNLASFSPLLPHEPDCEVFSLQVCGHNRLIYPIHRANNILSAQSSLSDKGKERQ